MQGLTDEPLNEKGISQAKWIGEKIKKDYPELKFDAIYASPLGRAINTASIISGVDPSAIIVDPRIIEVDFGKYEKMPYRSLGLHMTLYWMFPEFVPAPKGVETIDTMVKRSREFLKEIEQKEYENVLIVCHGGIIRALCGYLEDRKSGVRWRPKPKNCEVRVYESRSGVHKPITSIVYEDSL